MSELYVSGSIKSDQIRAHLLCLRVPMSIHGFLGVYGCLCLFMDVNGFLSVYGRLWVFMMSAYGYLQVFMGFMGVNEFLGVYGYLRVFLGF